MEESLLLARIVTIANTESETQSTIVLRKRKVIKSMIKGKWNRMKRNGNWKIRR